MDITLGTIVFLALAGVLAGLVGYLAGLMSLISYPALLAVGLSPLTANVTNTLGAIGVGAGAAVRAGDQVMAAGRTRAWQQFGICALGGGTGAVLLLVTGESVFETVVPWLIAFASLTLFVSPRLRRISNGTERWPLYLGVLFFVCLYGGYFGAGAGVLYFAVVVLLTSYPWPRAVLMKSVLLSISNLIATIIFIIFAPIDWVAALILFIGNLIGGNIGPLVQRYLPEKLSRWVIALGGLYLAWSLWS